MTGRDELYSVNQINLETMSHSQSMLAIKRCVLLPEASLTDSATTAHEVSVTADQPGDERYGAT